MGGPGLVDRGESELASSLAAASVSAKLLRCRSEDNSAAVSYPTKDLSLTYCDLARLTSFFLKFAVVVKS
jgi:hypothetical protein